MNEKDLQKLVIFTVNHPDLVPNKGQFWILELKDNSLGFQEWFEVIANGFQYEIVVIHQTVKLNKDGKRESVDVIGIIDNDHNGVADIIRSWTVIYNPKTEMINEKIIFREECDLFDNSLYEAAINRFLKQIGE